MNNKGFAITGIIYTLFILFLMILLTVLSSLNSFQRLIVNSTETLETSFEGKKISDEELKEIKTSRIAPYIGKYIFNTLNTDGDTIVCSSYINKNTNFNDSIFFPNECNDYKSSLELIEAYNFEEVN